MRSLLCRQLCHQELHWPITTERFEWNLTSPQDLCCSSVPNFHAIFSGTCDRNKSSKCFKVIVCHSLPRSPCNQMWLATVQPSVLSRKLRSGSWRSNAFELSVTPSCDRTWFVSTQPSAHVRILVCDSPRIWKLKATVYRDVENWEGHLHSHWCLREYDLLRWQDLITRTQIARLHHFKDNICWTWFHVAQWCCIQLVSPRKAGSWAETLEFLLAEMPRAKVWQRCDRQWSS